MTEQAGYLNAPDLVEECARAIYGAPDKTSGDFMAEAILHSPYMDSVEDAKALCHVAALEVLSVLRKRGLLTIQALELLADK